MGEDTNMICLQKDGFVATSEDHCDIPVSYAGVEFGYIERHGFTWDCYLSFGPVESSGPHHTISEAFEACCEWFKLNQTKGFFWNEIAV